MGSVQTRNVAVLGHKGSGKTSLIEAMLYLAKATPKLGKPGDRPSGLDDTPEEKAHETTLETRVACMKWNGTKVTLLDTPGEASFVADARLALAAADAAIVCVSARDGVQTGTERAFRWVRETKKPCLVVITKMDDERAHTDDILKAIKTELHAPITMMEVPQGEGTSFKGVIAIRTGKAWVGVPESPQSTAGIPIPPESKPRVDDARAHLVDDVAGTDDTLTEHYLNDGDLSQQELDEGARKAIAACKLMPVYEASSTMPSGMVALLDGIVELTPQPDGADDAPLSAFVFKTHVDPHAGRISYARVVSGVLKAESGVLCVSSNQKDRVSHLLQGTPKDAKPISEAHAGEIVALTKLKIVKTGETLVDEKAANPKAIDLPPKPTALLSRALIFDQKGVEDKAAQALSRIAEEDSALVFQHDEGSRALVVSGLGAMHLDVTLERMERRAGIKAKYGPPRVPYRETIRGHQMKVEGKLKKQTGGHGQFAVCYIDMEPAERGAGLVFEDAIVGGVIPRQWIPSVEKGVKKAMDHGVLAGYPVVDIKVRLVDGKYHDVDSSDAAFQVAGYRAFRAAMQASHPCILEPVVKLEVTVPNEAMGDVIGDLNSRHGKVTGTNQVDGGTVISAFVPLAATLDYEPKLTAMTRGRGQFTINFDHYDYCPPMTQDKVIKESGWKQVEEED